MTLTSGFFNSVSGDRLYNAVELSNFFDGVLEDGVFQSVGTAFGVTTTGTNVVVGSGRAWFNKTWTYNDSDLVLELPPPSNLNPRIDTLALIVDPTTAGRLNRIEFILGTPSTSPLPPVINPAVGTFVYTLADVYRPRDATTISQARITNRVGTATCPHAKSALQSLETFNTVSYKRNTVRGNFLGTSMTTAQKNAIISGSFEGLYLGDYWTSRGTHWRIVDFDYWLGQGYDSNTSGGIKRITRHHLVIVPDDTRAAVSNIRPYTSSPPSLECGWRFSRTLNQMMEIMFGHSADLFGTGHLRRSSYLTTSIAGSANAMNVEMQDVPVTPMSEAQLFGTSALGLRQQDGTLGQFALYRHGPRNHYMGQADGLVSSHQAFWLANQFSQGQWVCCHDYGGAMSHSTSSADQGALHQPRPVFGVTGRNTTAF